MNDTPGLTHLDSRRTRAQEAAQVLSSSIIHGQLAPGSLHSVRSLAEVLGVSRTPIREALIELASRGMIRFERNRGVRILQNSIHDIEEIFQLRLLLEVPAARQAAEQIDRAGLRGLRANYTGMTRAAAADDEQALWAHDRAFHYTLLMLAGNKRLADYVDSLRDMVLLRGATTAGRSRSLRSIAVEHLPILEAVEHGDAEATATAMKLHLDHTERLLIAQETGPTPAAPALRSQPPPGAGA